MSKKKRPKNLQSRDKDSNPLLARMPEGYDPNDPATAISNPKGKADSPVFGVIVSSDDTLHITQQALINRVLDRIKACLLDGGLALITEDKNLKISLTQAEKAKGNGRKAAGTGKKKNTDSVPGPRVAVSSGNAEGALDGDSKPVSDSTGHQGGSVDPVDESGTGGSVELGADADPFEGQ